jgi:anti-anti-sigma factor
MLGIDIDEEGRVSLSGRLDAAQAPRAQDFLDTMPQFSVVDLRELEYISSAGLGVLFRTHNRLTGSGRGLRLVNVNRHINDIFTYSGFDRLFDIESLGDGG